MFLSLLYFKKPYLRDVMIVIHQLKKNNAYTIQNTWILWYML